MEFTYKYFRKGLTLEMAVFNSFNSIVWKNKYPAFTEDAATGDLYEDFNLVELGKMKDLQDVEGLKNHLVDQSIMSPEDTIKFIL